MNPSFFRFTAIFLLPGLFLMPAVQAGCAPSVRDQFVKIILPDGESIRAELAVSDRERQRGLMFRESLDKDQGMLFVFEEEAFYSFWMKNTWIPLDILWLDRGKRIVHIETDVPPCREEPCPSYGTRLPALYVLELKAGSVEARGLKMFDRLEFILPDWVKKRVRE